MINNFKFIFSLFFLTVFTSINSAFAQTETKLKCPDFTFSRDLIQGSVGADVRLLQEILNTDYRTRIALTGNIGGSGRETANFQTATRESVKRFQALFIEYIGLANGKVGPVTRSVLNNVCQGPYFKGVPGAEPFDGATNPVNTNNDKIAPSVNITAPVSANVGESYRVFVYGSEAIKTPSASSFIVDGEATLSDIRKESPQVYKILVTPTKLISHTVKIQMEADAIEDLAGNKSQYASNEVSTVVSPIPAGPDIVPPGIVLSTPFYLKVGDVYRLNIQGLEDITEPKLTDFIITGKIKLSDLKKIDNKNYSALVTTTETGPYTATVQFPAFKVQDKAGNENTASNILNILVLSKTTPVPTTPSTGGSDGFDNGGSSGGSGGGSSMSPIDILMNGFLGIKLLKDLGLFGSGGSQLGDGGSTFGGKALLPSGCACNPKRRTIQFLPTGGNGVAGYYFNELNPTVQPSCFVTGFPVMIPAGPGNVCGSALVPKVDPTFGPAYCRVGIPYNGQCCVNPQSNTTGALVIGSFPPPPVIRGCGI